MFHCERTHLVSLTDSAQRGQHSARPASAEGQLESKRQWEAMADDAKESYKTAAEASNVLGRNVLISGEFGEMAGALEDHGDGIAGGAGILPDAPLLPHPCPEYRHLVCTTTGSGDGQTQDLYPISQKVLEESPVSLKSLDTSWKVRCAQVKEPSSLPENVKSKPSCIEVGGCIHTWQRLKWPWWKRLKLLDQTHKAIARWSIPLHLSALPRPKVGEVIVYEGCRGDTMAYRLFFMIGNYFKSPVKYQFLQFKPVHADDDAKSYPVSLLPCSRPFVASRRDTNGFMNRQRGALSWRRHAEEATAILSLPDVPVQDLRCKWFVGRGHYCWECLTNPALPLAQIKVVGIQGSMSWVDGPKPVTRVAAPGGAGAPPKAKPAAAKAKPCVAKPKAAAHPKPVPHKPIGALPPAAAAAPPCMSFFGDDNYECADHTELAMGAPPAPAGPHLALPPVPMPKPPPPPAAAPTPPPPKAPAAAASPALAPSIMSVLGEDDEDAADHMALSTPPPVSPPAAPASPMAPAIPCHPAPGASPDDGETTDHEWKPDDEHCAGFEPLDQDDKDSEAYGKSAVSELEAAHEMSAFAAKGAGASASCDESMDHLLPSITEMGGRVTVWIMQGVGCYQRVRSHASRHRSLMLCRGCPGLKIQ